MHEGLLEDDEALTHLVREDEVGRRPGLQLRRPLAEYPPAPDGPPWDLGRGAEPPRTHLRRGRSSECRRGDGARGDKRKCADCGNSESLHSTPLGSFIALDRTVLPLLATAQPIRCQDVPDL